MALPQWAREVSLNLTETFARFDEELNDERAARRPSFRRVAPRARRVPFVAYDLETTSIAAGTPVPLYVTAYYEAEAGTYERAERLASEADLLAFLEREFLVPEFEGWRFVAWNANGFDAYLVARAILQSDKYIIRPYLTQSKALRGFRVYPKDLDEKEARKRAWEFLDGMSMTGLDAAKMKLEKFVSLFAPELPKLSLDFGAISFNADDPEHCAYALRDSVALFKAMQRAEDIVYTLTGIYFAPTMGNLAVRYLQSQLPEGVVCRPLPRDIEVLMVGDLKRGGYCWSASQFHGPVWKYDLNQAYAAAMRDAALPCGLGYETEEYRSDAPGVYQVTASRARKTRVPFYYKCDGVAGFSDGYEFTAWITTQEIDELKREGWRVKIGKGFFWEDSFNLRAMVDELERLRFSDPAGPSGALGTMVKQIGNSAYGKTLEQLNGMEYILARDQPAEDYFAVTSDEAAASCIWQRQGEIVHKAYHQPQLGVFITAHVRMILRRAAIGAEDAFLYADTDCGVFTRPVAHIEVDPRRYGAWKQEAAGEEHILIGKKVYWSPSTHKAKGLNVRRLTREDYVRWLGEDQPPEQTQTQRVSFTAFLGGAEMFRDLDRRGTDVTASKTVTRENGGAFVPLARRLAPIVESL